MSRRVVYKLAILPCILVISDSVATIVMLRMLVVNMWTAYYDQQRQNGKISLYPAINIVG